MLNKKGYFEEFVSLAIAILITIGGSLMYSFWITGSGTGDNVLSVTHTTREISCRYMLLSSFADDYVREAECPECMKTDYTRKLYKKYNNFLKIKPYLSQGIYSDLELWNSLIYKGRMRGGVETFESAKDRELFKRILSRENFNFFCETPIFNPSKFVKDEYEGVLWIGVK